ncbi:MAG: hypothetical protein CL840_12845 [Crocinitomicaceae bacterium]|nr:hypothetical protein [Crocinitomicaceae bacterium]|tara:strand:+ start:1935 stop:2597 length:663 start_codon:yes stop_codon:yes gene_type:complete
MFDKDYLDFFKELAANNKKEWFDENRKRYEKSVKKPFNLFVTELLSKVRELDDEVQIQAKDSIFRINRDIRFSADKTPYKLHMAAILSPGGRKNKEVPGLYIQSSPEEIKIYGGIHMAGKDNLYELRNYIATNGKEFTKLISDKKFTSTFGEILGDKSKRIPPELKEAAEKQPMIYNKAFYFVHTLPAEAILEDNIVDTIIDLYKTALDFNQFVRKAIHY